MIDPVTNRTSIRQVDLSSYTYSVARAYMIRLEKSDFETPAMLASLAAEAGMTPHQFRERYEYLVHGDRRIQRDACADASGVTVQPDPVPSPIG